MLQSMMKIALELCSVLATAAGGVPAQVPPAVDAPVYVAGGQYSATLDQGTRNWRLLPLDGQDLIVANPDVYCRADAAIPSGVWLVASDPTGGIELRATSQIDLPAGHPAQVALRACGETGGGLALHAPRVLIELLAGRTGAVFVHH